MSRFRITAPASDDIRELTTYYSARSRKFARRLAAALRRTFRVVGRTPLCGTAVVMGNIRMRKMAVLAHLVFFRDTPTGVEILRVIDGRRQLDDSLFDTPDPTP